MACAAYGCALHAFSDVRLRYAGAALVKRAGPPRVLESLRRADVARLVAAARASKDPASAF
eukprot:183702-Alexandrium_andersonii.AAC.1